MCCSRLVNEMSLKVILTKTIVKSNKVQKLVKYLKKPNAIHFRNISIMNIMQNPRFVQYNILFSGIFFSKWISSKHSVILDANMRTKMNHSKAGVST